MHLAKYRNTQYKYIHIPDNRHLHYLRIKASHTKNCRGCRGSFFNTQRSLVRVDCLTVLNKPQKPQNFEHESERRRQIATKSIPFVDF